jgi:uncharacterized membrane protein YkoI
MKTTPSLCFAKSTTLAVLLGLTLTGGFLRAEDDAALLGRLKDSKLSLAAGIAQSEKENGVAISAKFEMEGEAVNLSVYTAKAGLAQDSEHNVLIELAGDSAKSPWKPEAEVFEDKKHLTRSAMQLTLVQLSKVSLVEAISKAEAAQPGTVYSITPAVKAGEPVFNVKVATAAGKSVAVVVNGETGAVSK